MDENTTKIIKEKFDSLPEGIRETILSSNYQETLLEVGKQYQLTVGQMGTLEMETTLVMMGLTPTTDFEVELIRELNVDKTKGYQIVKDINEKIFLKIRELLKSMNTPKGEGSPVEEVNEAQINDTQILNSAGIEIIPDLSAMPRAQLMQAGKLELGAGTNPILSQKLLTSIKIPTVKTDHSLSNLTSSNAPSTGAKADPYRMPVE